MPVKKGLSYTQRTLRALREQGRICAVTEKWNPYGGPMINGKRVGVRQDLFGFIDILCLDSARGFVAIQSTGPSGFADHKRAILANEMALEWLRVGRCFQAYVASNYKGLQAIQAQLSYIELWSWRKLKKERGGKLRVWTPRIEPITLDMFGG